MILPGCTRGHIRARYVLQGYLIRNLILPSVGFFFLGHRWAFFFKGAIGGSPRLFFFSLQNAI